MTSMRCCGSSVASRRCDIAIPSHPGTNATLDHLAALEHSRARNPLIETAPCKALAATYAQRLDARLAVVWRDIAYAISNTNAVRALTAGEKEAALGKAYRVVSDAREMLSAANRAKAGGAK